MLEKQYELLKNINDKIKELKELHDEINSHLIYEEIMYRYYHHSFKVYYVQEYTIKVFEILKTLAPKETQINKQIENLIQQGTGKKFILEHNKNWDKHTLPMIQAFFHMKYLLEMIVKYHDIEPRYVLKFGWASVLYFYCMR